MSLPHLPWEPSYTPPPVDADLLQSITGAVEATVSAATHEVTDLGSQIAGQVAGPAVAQAVQDVGAVAQATEAVAGGVVESVLPPAGASVPGVPGTIGAPGSWVDAIEEAAKVNAEAALKSALPALQDRIAHQAEKILAEELSKALGTGQPPLATIPSGDLKKLDAWERASRTFFAGLFATVLGAIVQVIGSLATDGTHVDFFHQEGWKAVGTLAVGAVITAVSTYLLRYLKEPAGAAIDSSSVKTP